MQFALNRERKLNFVNIELDTISVPSISRRVPRLSNSMLVSIQLRLLQSATKLLNTKQFLTSRQTER